MAEALIEMQEKVINEAIKVTVGKKLQNVLIKAMNATNGESFHTNLVDEFMKETKRTFASFKEQTTSKDVGRTKYLTLVKSRISAERQDDNGYKFRRCAHDDLTNKYLTCEHCSRKINEALENYKSIDPTEDVFLKTKKWLDNSPSVVASIQERNLNSTCSSFKTCPETTNSGEIMNGNNDDDEGACGGINEDDYDDEDACGGINEDDYNDEGAYGGGEDDDGAYGCDYRAYAPVPSLEYLDESQISNCGEWMKDRPQPKGAYGGGGEDDDDAYGCDYRANAAAPPSLHDSDETITSECKEWTKDRPHLKIPSGNTNGRCFKCQLFGHLQKDCLLNIGMEKEIDRYRRMEKEKREKFQAKKAEMDRLRFNGNGKCVRCNRRNDHTPKTCWAEDGKATECFQCWRPGVRLPNCPRCGPAWRAQGGKYNAETRDKSAKETFVRVPGTRR